MTSERLKALLICPPTSSVNCVPAGIYALSAVLKSAGYQTKTLDLNTEFFKYVLNRDYLLKCIKEVEKSDIPEVKEDFEKNKGRYLDFIDKMPKVVRILKGKGFYEIKNLRSSYHIIDTLLHLVSLTIYPFTLGRNGFFKSDERMAYDTHAKYTDNNIFKKFFEGYLEEISDFNPNLIGMSLAYDTQMLSSLTLSKMLREKNIKGKIVFGGANITRRVTCIKEFSDLFEKYADGILVGSGDISIVEYMEYLEGKRSQDEVINLIYKKGGKIIENKISLELPQKNYYYDYSDYNSDNYLLPEGVLHLTTATGCYYDKCSFCFHNEMTPYIQKSVDCVIDEIKEIIKTKNVNKFIITDNALNPQFAQEFSRKIIEQKVEIYYGSDMRFEKQYDYDLLKQLYKSGLRVCYWGLESASNRVLKFLDKGTNIETNKRILEDAHKIGIYNFVYYMLGIPTETKEEMTETINFMVENSNIIDNCLGTNFLMLKNIRLYKKPEKYGLTKDEVYIKIDFEYCPEPLRKVTLKEIETAKNIVNSYYNNIYKQFLKYGTNDIIILYKANKII